MIARSDRAGIKGKLCVGCLGKPEAAIATLIRATLSPGAESATHVVSCWVVVREDVGSFPPALAAAPHELHCLPLFAPCHVLESMAGDNREPREHKRTGVIVLAVFLSHA